MFVFWGWKLCQNATSPNDIKRGILSLPNDKGNMMPNENRKTECLKAEWYFQKYYELKK